MQKYIAMGWVFLAGVGVCPAEVGVSEVTDALTRMGQRLPTAWAYTRTVIGKEMETVARRDPRVAGTVDGWTLLRVNGGAPSEKEAEKFYATIRKQAERAEEAGDTAPDLAELIQSDTLSLLRVEDSGQSVFGFVPKIDDLEDVLVGELVFSEEEQRIKSLRVWNREVYSPAFSVKVTEFSLGLAFGVNGSDTVLTQMVTTVKGRVGFVKKVDEAARITFTDYELLDGGD